MKGPIALALVVGSSLFARSGAADTNTGPENPFETPWTQPLRTTRWVSDDVPRYNGHDEIAAAQGFSNVIYLNNCKPGGCSIKAGFDNSLTNTSQIPQQTSNVSAFNGSDATWQAVVNCVRETYAPFGVSIVDQRPASGNYHMAIVAGSPGNIGEPNGVGGVSPFGCGYLPNAISFSFANIYGGDVDQICWTVAQETAHSWGLDHKFDNRDPMTYLQSGPSRKSFQNQAGPCGTFSAASCQCGGSSMNSFAEIMDTFGGSTPTPPTVHITAPTNNATGLDKGFQIKSDCTDDVAISKAELRIDNNLIATLTQGPYIWTAPAALAQGMHTLEVTCYDIGNTPSKDTIKASLGNPCSQSSDCATGTDVCVDGRCVRGSGAAGGLGTTCGTNTECASGSCTSDAGGNHYCVESCDPAADGCPSNFTCIPSGASGVCWPGGDGGGGVCSSGGNSGPAFLLMGIAAILVIRRRRR